MKRNIYEISLTAVCISCLVMFNYPRFPLLLTIISFCLMFLFPLWMKFITNQQEKKRIRFALIAMFNLCWLSVVFEPFIELHGYKVFTKPFYWLNNNIGWTACIVLGFSFLLLPVYKLIRYKKVFISIAKFLRKWHVPIALLGISFVFFHVYLALVSGFKWNYTYLSGYAALLDLLLVSLLGLLRFKKADRNLHKILSYVLIVFLTLHIIFSELRL